MKHYLLFYDYTADYLERRTALRPAHLVHARAAVARGELDVAGACTDPGAPIGVLVFKASDRSVVEDFARADPYVREGLAVRWHVREWTTVMGPHALTPIPE
ncbi:MAG: hypothetical protein ABS36_18895 [Acidobacteria bacterium SCN 69-37]|nr:MAG: hypothetical protein ABS36_18895 [Acidobacteria bacterium SCN 69-37]